MLKRNPLLHSLSIVSFWRSLFCSWSFRALLVISIIFFTAPIGHAATLSIPEKTATEETLTLDNSQYGALLLIDESSGKILYAYEAGKEWTAASLTKLMTALTFASTPTNWDATGSILSQDEVGGGRLRVNAGTLLSLKDVLYSAIIGSANNAAEALGRMFDTRPKNTFVAEMNAYAKKLGLEKTVFYDASGMNERNTITAFDIATIFLACMNKVEEAQKAMVLPTYQFTLRSPVATKTIKNTNDLLFVEPDIIVTGGKTGYLIESKYNYIVRAHPKDAPEKSVVAVVLGSASREDSFDTAVALMRWGWKQFTWKEQTVPFVLSQGYMIGDRNPEIRELQAFLNTNGFPIASSGAGSLGKETDFFGAKTKEALIRFQKSKIEDPLAIRDTTASGYVDLFTKYALYTQKSTKTVQSAAVTQQKEISAITPSSESLRLSPMGLGARNADVRVLQTMLAKDAEVYPEAMITGYFGPLTEKAVQRFQIKHNVVQSPADPGYGYVGPATRAALERLYANAS